MKRNWVKTIFQGLPYLLIVVVLIVVLMQVGMKQKPSFTGVIVDVRENSLLIQVDEGESARLSSDLISVALTLNFPGNDQQFEVNQRVKVFYDGVLLESYPAQLPKPYAIVLEKN